MTDDAAMAVTTTHYACNGEVNLAYQVHGDGPVDLLFVSAFISHVEHVWENPGYARFLGRLMGFARLIIWDRRGSGLSDDGPLGVEHEIDDVTAVLDAAGSTRAAVLAYNAGGPLAALYAARRPERVAALVLYGCLLRAVRDDDLPWVEDEEERERRVGRLIERWGEGTNLEVLAPTAADDLQLRAWLARLERLAASPGQARRLVAAAGQIDVRPALRVDQRADARAAPHRRGVRGRAPLARVRAADPGRAARRAAGRRLAAERRRPRRAARRDRGVPHRRAPRRRARARAADRAVHGHRRQHGARGGARRQALARPARDARHRGAAHAAALRRGRHPAHRRRLPRGLRRRPEPRGALRASRCATSSWRRASTCASGCTRASARSSATTSAGWPSTSPRASARSREPGEILVSGTTYGTVFGAGLDFDYRGEKILKGVPGRWPIFALNAD